MNNKSESQAKRYENVREDSRRKARSEFFQVHRKSNHLVDLLNEVVARPMYFSRGRSFKHIDNGTYFSKLIVSFTRTHFILCDLIICNELIDASVLFRKQLELVSRLVELEAATDASKLLNKTPNIKHLKFGLNKLYPVYSELSHSAAEKIMHLLGSKEFEGGMYTSVFPVFDENSYVALSHLFLLVTQYHYWVTDKYEKWFDDYNREEDCKIYKKCLELFNQVYYEKPNFKSIRRKRVSEQQIDG